jgi:hypothetical protein
VKKEMTEDLHQDLKKEVIAEVHLVKKELTEDLHQDLKKEMIAEVRLVKKVAKLQSPKKNLLKDLPRNLHLNLNNFFY